MTEPTQPLTDEQLEDIRDWHNKTRDRRVGALLGELDRLRTWDGLMEMLDEKWPEDIFPTSEDDTARDPGPRIVSLLRWNIRLRRELAEVKRERDDLWVRTNAKTVIRQSISELEDEVSRLRAENTALRASVDQFRSFPTDPGVGDWSTSYRMGYADAGRDVHAIVRALGLDQDGEGQANG